MRPAFARLTRLGTLAIALTATIAAAATPATDPQKVSLQPSFTPGYETKVIMETTRSVTLEVDMPDGTKQDRTTSGQHTIEFLYKVVKSDAAGSTVTLRIDRIEMTAKTLRGDFAWKSTDPRSPDDANNRALTTMRPSLGATVTIDLDAKGNVTRVDNGGVQMTPGDLADFINLVVGPADVRNRWSPVLSPRKGDFVAAIGETWSGEEKLTKPPFGIFVASTNYTLKSADDQQAIVALDGKFTLEAAPDSPQKLFDVKDSSMSGTLVWDRTVGMFKTYEAAQRLTLKGIGQGFSMGQRTETTVKIRREDPKAEAKPQ